MDPLRIFRRLRYVSLIDAAREFDKAWLVSEAPPTVSHQRGRECDIIAPSHQSPGPFTIDSGSRGHREVSTERAFIGTTGPDRTVAASLRSWPSPRMDAEVWSIIQRLLLDGTLAAYLQLDG